MFVIVMDLLDIQRYFFLQIIVTHYSDGRYLSELSYKYKY